MSTSNDQHQGQLNGMLREMADLPINDRIFLIVAIIQTVLVDRGGLRLKIAAADPPLFIVAAAMDRAEQLANLVEPWLAEAPRVPHETPAPETP